MIGTWNGLDTLSTLTNVNYEKENICIFQDLNIFDAICIKFQNNSNYSFKMPNMFFLYNNKFENVKYFTIVYLKIIAYIGGVASVPHITF